MSRSRRSQAPGLRKLRQSQIVSGRLHRADGRGRNRFRGDVGSSATVRSQAWIAASTSPPSASSSPRRKCASGRSGRWARTCRISATPRASVARSPRAPGRNRGGPRRRTAGDARPPRAHPRTPADAADDVPRRSGPAERPRGPGCRAAPGRVARPPPAGRRRGPAVRRACSARGGVGRGSASARSRCRRASSGCSRNRYSDPSCASHFAVDRSP